jgi:hypothetical protein
MVNVDPEQMESAGNWLPAHLVAKRGKVAGPRLRIVLGDGTPPDLVLTKRAVPARDDAVNEHTPITEQISGLLWIPTTSTATGRPSRTTVRRG